MTAIPARLTRIVAVLALVLAGSFALAFEPGNTLADHEDDSFGIEQFRPITINEQTILDLEAAAENFDQMTLLAVYIELQNLGEFETDLSKDSFRETDDLDDVVQHLDGDFAHPEDLPTNLEGGRTHFMVGDAGSASYTFDVAGARRISELLELPADWLPDPSEQSHLTVSVDLPKSGAAAWTKDEQALIMGQIGVPDIAVPESIDLEALRDAVIDDPRLPDDLTEQLGAIDDWEHTLPVPVPEGAEYQDVTIDGNAGMTLSIDEGSVLVWQRDRTLHVVAGTYDAETLERLADSMQ